MSRLAFIKLGERIVFQRCIKCFNKYWQANLVLLAKYPQIHTYFLAIHVLGKLVFEMRSRQN